MKKRVLVTILFIMVIAGLVTGCAEPATIQASTELVTEWVCYGCHETESISYEDSQYNMALASKMLNGIIIQPGEEFSWKSIFGEYYSQENGFKKATLLGTDAYVSEVGVGVGQTLLTLYSACNAARIHTYGFEIEKLIGMSSFEFNVLHMGKRDFLFTNTLNVPIRLAFVTDGNWCYCQLLIPKNQQIL